MFLFETHCHTSESSSCGQVPAAQAVALYQEAGYDGMVITDHLSAYSFAHHPAFAQADTWEEKIDCLMAGYHSALSHAPEGFCVLPGVELRFLDSLNDYLLYGADEDFLKSTPDLMAMGLKAFSQLSREKGFLLFQAHPFRNRMTVSDPALLDGIEVQNGNVRHDPRNEVAALWAKLHGLLSSSGSDFHRVEDVGRGGVLLARMPQDIQDFIQLMQAHPPLVWGREKNL